MSLSLNAFLNQRFQLTYDVAVYASLYFTLPTATWRFQVRPSTGSPIVLLDFQTGGSPMSAQATITYNTTSKLVTINGPTSLMIGLPPGTYEFDFGFTLPGGADFERVDGGSITFAAGTTLAGVPGSPPPPTGSDDTVLMGSGSIPTVVPATLLSALSAASSSASAALTSQNSASSSATAAAASAAAASASQIAAGLSVIDAQNAGEAALAALGLLFVFERLTVTVLDTLPNLGFNYSGSFSLLSVNNVLFMPVPTTPAYTISGRAILWSFANSGFHVNPGDDVEIVYTRVT